MYNAALGNLSFVQIRKKSDAVILSNSVKSWNRFSENLGTEILAERMHKKPIQISFKARHVCDRTKAYCLLTKAKVMADILFHLWHINGID